MDLINILPWDVRTSLFAPPPFSISCLPLHVLLWEFNIPHLNLFRSNRPDGYGGSAIASHTSLNVRKIDINTTIKHFFCNHKINLIGIEVLNLKYLPIIPFWS